MSRLSLGCPFNFLYAGRADSPVVQYRQQRGDEVGPAFERQMNPQGKSRETVPLLKVPDGEVPGTDPV